MHRNDWLSVGYSLALKARNTQPVLKITGSRTAAEKMIDHIDMNLSAVIDGGDTIPDAGQRVLEELVRVASGAMTKAELSGYVNSMDIFMRGPVI